jgi:serine/threonine protein kinase
MSEQTIFLAALEIPDPAERSAYLHTATGGDETLRRQVESLLAAHERPGPFLDVPICEQMAARPSPAEQGTAALQADPTGESVPEAVLAELGRHERYRVVRRLGQGGMGMVYEAEHRVMRRPVALKIIHRRYTATAAAAQRFRREVRAAALLHHPNIVTAFDADNVGDTHFLIMEYVEGRTLARLVKERGPLPVREACEYVRQAALGLQHAHERGMVHRDVKPDNLMLTPDGTVKVLDFGLAALTAERGADGLTEANVIMGTPDYMAPEQAEDVRKADIRADVYSLGCSLYHLLTGRIPYPADTPLLKILAHRERPVPSIRSVRHDVPRELEVVLACLLAKEPADRYQTPGAVAAALAPFAQPAPVPPQKRGRWLVAALVALLFAGITVAGAVVYHIQTDTGELVVTTESDDVEVVIKQGGKEVRLIDTKTDKQIKLTLRSGVYELELKGVEGLKLSIDKATLTRGETVLAKIERRAKANAPSDDLPVIPKPLEVAQRLPWPGRNNLATSFSGDSRLCLAFALGSDAFRVWETETGKLVQAVDRLPPTPTVRFLPDGKQLLSSHSDGTFRRWDLNTGKMLDQIRSTLGWPLIQGFASDGDGFASYSNNQVQVWDLKTGKERFHVEPLREKAILLASAPLSPDGKRLLTVDHFGSDPGHVRIFDAATGKQHLSKAIPFGWPDVQTWSADSRRIYLRAGEEGHSVIACLDADTGEIISKVQLVPEPGSSFGNAFSRDTRYYAVQYPSANLIHLYDTRTGKLVGTASGPNAEFSLSFSPNGRYVACGGRGEVIFYRLPNPPVQKEKP